MVCYDTGAGFRYWERAITQHVLKISKDDVQSDRILQVPRGVLEVPFTKMMSKEGEL